MRRDEAPTTGDSRRLALACLATVTLSFLVFGFALAARLENPLWNAPNFSGWAAAIGHQLVMGRRLYRDITLPIPPGAFLLMAAIERSVGHGPRLVYENRVCEICYALLALIGYAIAKPLAGRRVALFTAAAATAWASLWKKQIAYDAMAEVAAWGAIALMVRAWVSERGATERRWLFAAGLAAAAALLFKQSTATGVFAGGVVGLGYLALVERRVAGALRGRTWGALAFGGGALAGALLAVGGFGLAGGSMGGFLRSVFVDGTAEKGGWVHLATRAARGLVTEPAVVWPIGVAVVFAALLFRIVRGGSGLSLGKRAPGALRPRDAIGVATAAIVIFGYAACVLAGWLHGSPLTLLVNFASPQLIAIGAGLAVAFFFGNFTSPANKTAHAFNAAALAALVLASTVSLSMTYFDPLYENNALMAVLLVALFAGLEHARLRGLSWLGLVIMMGQPLAWRVPQAALSRHPAPADSFFGGMWLDGAGLKTVRVAARVRTAAGPHGSVLSFPEDPVLEALVDRPRPALCGAIVFPDQYPQRCVAHDAALLDRDPPDVLVLRPANRAPMLHALRMWNAQSPAEQLIVRVLERHLGDYRRVASYPMRWTHGEVVLQIWRRR
jgi:hypothetical protein